MRAHEYDYAITVRFENGETTGYFGFGYYDWAEKSGLPFLIGVPEKRTKAIREENLILKYQEDELFYYGIEKSVFRSDSALSDIIDLFLHTIGMVSSTPLISGDEITLTESHLDLWFHAPPCRGNIRKMVDALMQVRRILQNRENLNIKIQSSFDEYSIVSLLKDAELYLGLFFWNWKDEGVALWAGVPREKQSRVDTTFLFTEKRFHEEGWTFRPLQLNDKRSQSDVVAHILVAAMVLLGH